jgi:surface antigen
LVSSSAKRCISCIALIFAGAANVTGCARGVPDPGLRVDRSISTSSVVEAGAANVSNPFGLETEAYRDGETISNAVSSVEFTGAAIAWQNPATGSSGDITSVNQSRTAGGQLCRRFTALRTSYDGIHNYAGLTCMNDAGVWQLTEFAQN